MNTKQILLNESLEPQRIKTQKDLFQDPVRKCYYGEIVHRNYLEYLSIAWGNHYGVVFSPDIAWYIALNEMASIIKKYPEAFRSIFTASSEKTDIKVLTMDPELISLDLIIDALRTLVPTDVSLYVPTFTTSTPTSRLAFIASFADAMTPYYNYGMYCCGIPKVKILGEEKDWELMINNLTTIREECNYPALSVYIHNIIIAISRMRLNIDEIAFWDKMFELERCGSGGQTEVKGWIEEFFIETPRIKYIENYPSMIAVVPYTNLDTKKEYELKYGLFSSNIEDGYLVPDFGYVILDK